MSAISTERWDNISTNWAEPCRHEERPNWNVGLKCFSPSVPTNISFIQTESRYQWNHHKNNKPTAGWQVKKKKSFYFPRLNHGVTSGKYLFSRVGRELDERMRLLNMKLEPEERLKDSLRLCVVTRAAPLRARYSMRDGSDHMLCAAVKACHQMVGFSIWRKVER